MGAATGFGLGSSLAASKGYNSAAGAAMGPGIFSQAVDPMQGAAGLAQFSIAQEQKGLNNQAENVLNDAALEEQQTARQASQFRESQALGYSGNGVLLEGSPMLVLNQTRQLAQQQLDAISRRATLQADLLRQRSYIVGSEGRANLLGAQDQFITGQAQARIAALNTAAGLQAQGVSARQSMFSGLFGGLDKVTGSLVKAGFNGLFGAGGSSGGNWNQMVP